MGSVICKVAAHQLGDKTVGRIVGLKTLGDAEIVDEALRKAYVSGQANVILAADAFPGIVPGPELDGKTMVLTFTIGNRKAVKSAVLRYVG